MFIFKHNAQGHGLGLERLTLGCRAQFKDDPITRLDACGHLHGRLPIQGYSVSSHQLLQVTPRKLGVDLHQNPVKPLTVLAFLNEEFPQLHVGASINTLFDVLRV
jgi:hypothetical protein